MAPQYNHQTLVKPRRATGCLEAALEYHGFGLSVVACCPHDHQGIGEWHLNPPNGKPPCTSPGKAVWHKWKALQKKPATESVIRGWFRKVPNSNVGILLGEASNVVRADVDSEAARTQLLAMNGGVEPVTWTFTTDTGGFGYLWAVEPGTPLKTTIHGQDGQHSELRFQANGAQTVMPPSIHPKGGVYRWVPGRGTGEVELATAPPWLLAELAPEKPKPPAGEPAGKGFRRRTPGPHGDVMTRAIAYLGGIPPAISEQGGHSQTIWAASCMARGFSLGEAVAFDLLWAHYNPRCQPPWSEAELRHKCNQAIVNPADKPEGWLLNAERPMSRIYAAISGTNGVHGTGVSAAGGGKGSEQPPPIHLTDEGNARRLVALHGRDLRYCHPWKKWLAWDDRRFAIDDTGEVFRRAKHAVTSMFAEAGRGLLLAATEPDPDRRKAAVEELQRLQSWALKSEDVKRLKAIIELAQSEPGIPVLPADLDADPWLLNCPNGTLDLRTGKLREHRREDLLTKLCPTPFDPSAGCHEWEIATRAILDGNPEMIAYAKRLCGHALTGDVREQILPIPWGDGSNGKSLWFDTLLAVWGPDYAGVAPSELLMLRRGDTHPTTLAGLFGKRLVVASESGEGCRLNEALVKTLTGGEAITARRMREDYWTFPPTHKLFFVTNHRPEVRGSDHGIWRRLKLIPFVVKFWDPDKSEKGEPHLKADKTLKEKLLVEATGILAWCVRGCLDWQASGLQEPKGVTLATEDFRGESDLIARFIGECCHLGKDLKSKASAVYKRYCSWHEAAGEDGKPISHKKFGQQLRRKGVEAYPNNGTWYSGLMLAHNPNDDPQSIRAN